MSDRAVSFILKTLFILTLSVLTLSAHAELPVARGSATDKGASTVEPEPEWLYTLKPGESFAKAANKLLNNHHNPRQLLQYNAIDRTRALTEGDSIRVPLAWLKQEPSPARATSVSGNVQLISSGGRGKRPLTNDALIRVGDEVISAEGSALITLADGSEVRLSPNSRLIFNRLTQFGKTGMADTRLRLNRGGVRTRVKPVTKGDTRFEIETPSAVAAVRGTAFALQTGGAATHLQVTEGTVEFGIPGKLHRVPAGYSATISGNRPNIQRMPAAPVITRLPTPLTQLPAEVTWEAGSTTHYRLDIFEAESGHWVENRKVAGNQFKISRLDNGRYEMQLAALDPQGAAGMPAVRLFEVDLQAYAANLVSPDEGDSTNDDMPEFRWSLNGSNELARIEIAEDKAFNNLVATSEWAPETTALPSRPLKAGEYYWRVVTEAGGNSVAASPSRKLTVNGTLPPVRIISVNYIDSQVRVFWESLAEASKYRVQLADSADFNNVIKEATLKETTAALRLVPGRRYFIRLKALTDGPLHSQWGPGRELYLE